MWTAAGSPCVPLPDPDPGWETGLGVRGAGGHGPEVQTLPNTAVPGPPGPRPPPLPQVRGQGATLWRCCCGVTRATWPGWDGLSQESLTWTSRFHKGPKGLEPSRGMCTCPPALLETAAAKQPRDLPGSLPSKPRPTPGPAEETHGQKPGSAGCAPLVWRCRMRQQGREAGVPDPAQALLGVSIPEHSPALLLGLFIGAVGTSKLYDFLDRVCPSYVCPLLFSEPQAGVLRAGVCPAHAL